MSLQPQYVEMPLIKGVDQKTDSKQVPLGKLLAAENVVFNKPGKIQKRNGYKSASRNILGGGQITDGQALANYKNELIAFDKANVYSYSEGTNNWVDKGDFTSAYVAATPVSNGAFVDSQSDSARHSSGIECFVFTSVQSNVTKSYYSVIDTSTGQTIISRKLISPDARYCQVVTYKNSFVIYYYNTNTKILYAAVLPIGNLSANLSFQAVTGNSADEDSMDNGNYRVATITTKALGEAIYLVFNSRTATKTVTLRRYINPLGNPASQTDASDAGNQYTSTTFALFYEQSYDGIFLGWCPDFVIKLSVYAPQLVDGAGDPYTLWNYDSVPLIGGIYNLQGISKSATNLDVDLFFSDNFVMEFVNVKEVSAVTSDTFTFTIPDANVASSPIIYGGKSYIVITAAPAQQGTFYLVDSSGTVIARYFATLAALGANNTYQDSNQAKLNMISATEFSVAANVETLFNTINNTNCVGVNRIQFDFFQPEKSYSRVELADNLYVGGGLLYAYDGISLVEAGFNYYPEGAATASNNSASVPESKYDYSYRFTYEWVDNYGNVEVSVPSNPVSISISASIDPSHPVNLTARSLNLTEKTVANGRAPVTICAYRTISGGNNYYKLPLSGSANVNDIAGYIQTLPQDKTTDSQLVGYEELYTNGDPAPLEHDPAPPVGGMTVYRNRLFVLDSTNPLTIYYSNFVTNDLPPNFNLAAVINIDPAGGPVTALAAMDDKLIIFKENQIRYITGNGPDTAGVGSDYENGGILITSDCGCTNLRSIVNTPEGLMFKGNKGIYMLNRGLQVTYIGNPVEDYNNNVVTSAILTNKTNQVRLTLDNNVALIYDYFIDAWCTFTNVNAVDSINWQNKHSYIRPNGQVMIEDPTSYTDDGSAIQMKITTSWVAFTGIQGFQRLWTAYLLGNWMSKHKLKVQLSYDYNENYFQEIVVDPVPLSVYGNGTYGEESLYGGKFSLYQYRINPERQKCQSMKMTITDIPFEGEQLKAGCQLSNIRFEYGVIGNSNRVRTRQQEG